MGVFEIGIGIGIEIEIEIPKKRSIGNNVAKMGVINAGAIDFFERQLTLLGSTRF